MGIIKTSKTADFSLKLGREYNIKYNTYLEKVLRRTDDVLNKIGREYATYLEKVIPIHYKNNTYHLINIFHSSQQIKCDICGNWLNPEIFIIESENGKRKKIGSICIDRLTNMEVSKWFKSYRKKRENIIKNSKKIDGLSALISNCKNCELTCNIPFGEVEKIKTILERLSKGLLLNWQQETITQSYLDGKKRLCECFARNSDKRFEDKNL